jgi:hypothetical protein
MGIAPLNPSYGYFARLGVFSDRRTRIDRSAHLTLSLPGLTRQSIFFDSSF